MSEDHARGSDSHRGAACPASRGRGAPRAHRRTDTDTQVETLRSRHSAPAAGWRAGGHARPELGRTHPADLGGTDRHGAGRAATGGRHAAARRSRTRSNRGDPVRRAPAVPGRSGADRPPRQPRAGRRLCAAARRQRHLARHGHAQLERAARDHAVGRGQDRASDGRRAEAGDEPGSVQRQPEREHPRRIERPLGAARTATVLEPVDRLDPARVGSADPTPPISAWPATG